MNFAISLNKDISCDYLCQQIQKAIDSYKKTIEPAQPIILTINLSNITEYEPSTEVKLLEVKNIH